MPNRWTEEQMQVIENRGKDLLVSAAAGSGKTAVLVERILRRIMDPVHPVDIDRLLVVTFTNAAAAEMRERIRMRLETALADDPENAHLQRQSVLVHTAMIMTIHSFCGEVIRTWFQAADIDPEYRVADENEIRLLREEILNELLNEQECPYARDTFASGKDDAALAQTILRFYTFSESYPWPKRWRSEMISMYETGGSETCAEEGADLSCTLQKEHRGDPVLWLEALVRMLRRTGEDSILRLRRALHICSLAHGPLAYEAALEADVERFEAAFMQPENRDDDIWQSFDTFRERILAAAGSWGPIGRISKKDDVREDYKEEVKDLRDGVKNQWKRIAEQLLYADSAGIRQLLDACLPACRELAALTDLFEERFTLEKRERRILDFPDLEHLALQILVREEDGHALPTEAAREYARRFEEVMCDEYQDSNLVQEYILSSVSGKGEDAHNRFMVGDVKQSIYRFRQARPELFMEKYRSWPAAGETSGAKTREESSGVDVREGLSGAEPWEESSEVPMREEPSAASAEHGTGHVRIELHKNFRSRPQVLEGVNMIFRQIMAEDAGEVRYDDAAALYPGAVYTLPAAGAEGASAGLFQPELWLTGGAEDADEDTPEEASGFDFAMETDPEADMIARRILQMAGSFPVQDAKTGALRPARYGDMVILLRSARGLASRYLQSLTQMNIPAYVGGGTGYFETIEIRTMLSALAVLDNPRQDIALAAFLRSPMCGYSDEDLAQIRIAAPGEDFYDACQAVIRSSGQDFSFTHVFGYAAHSSLQAGMEEDADGDSLPARLSRTFEMIGALRAEAVYTPVHALMWRILDLTGYQDAVRAMPAGEQRMANLRLLIERAVAYEQTSYRGLFHFLRYVEQIRMLEGDTAEAPTLPEDADVVRIMTIHKSKGLEFPIVFVGGLGRKINQMDTAASLVLHPSLGIGVNYTDRERHIRVTPPMKAFLARQIQLENLGEELRVLYVAMTRAREKLILTGTVRDVADAFRRWEQTARMSGDLLPLSVRGGAADYLALIMPALLRHESTAKTADMFGFERDQDFTTRRAWKDGCGFAVHLDEGTSNAGQTRAAELTGGEDEPDWLAELMETPQDQVFDERMRKQMDQILTEEKAPAGPHIPGKISVSFLKAKDFEAPEEALEAPWLKTDPKAETNEPQPETGPETGTSEPQLKTDPQAGKDKPAEKDSGRVTGAALGTVWHTVLEHLDYAALRDRSSPAAEVSEARVNSFVLDQLEALCRRGVISEEERQSIEPEKLARFVRSPIGRRMQQASAAGKLQRETPFVLGVPARELDPAWDSDETVLLQGIIDAWFYENGNIILLDYKTDRVDAASDPEGDVLVRHYRRQLELYARALEQLTQQPVSEQIIYSLTLGREIRVDLVQV